MTIMSPVMAITAEPRVIVVHDYASQRGGAERVALSLLRAFPGSSLVTSVFESSATYPDFSNFSISTTWLNKISPLRRDPRRALPLLAVAMGRVRLPASDVVVCSSSGWAHGVSSAAPIVVYCHNPARWLYQTDEYLADQPRALALALRPLLPLLRRWDRRGAGRAHTYLANSTVVAQRIRAAYGLAAVVVPPCAGLSPEGPMAPVPGVQPGFVLTVGRARGYKNTELVAEAVECTPGLRLVVVGGLPSGEWSERISGLQAVSDAQLRWLYANAACLVACSFEDFGLTPVEAYGFGTPAVVLRAGGYLDSTLPGITGEFTDTLAVDDIVAAISKVVSTDYDRAAIRVHGARYSEAAFHARIRAIVSSVMSGLPVSIDLTDVAVAQGQAWDPPEQVAEARDITTGEISEQR